MGQTAMYTPDPSTRGVSLQGVNYEVRDQIAVVDDVFVQAARSLGFVTAAEASIKAAELSSTAMGDEELEAATAPAPAAKSAPTKVADAPQAKGGK